MSQVFNFSAGPAMLPPEVLVQAQQELRDWQGLGMSVMEISHRSKPFMQLAEESIADLRALLAIPSHYQVLFCHGGARGQFAAVPLNLLNDRACADYFTSGYWSACAASEAEKYGVIKAHDIRTTEAGKRGVQPMKDWALSADAAYLHYCPNETIDGVAILEEPDFAADRVVVADYSSSILSAPLDVSRYGVIYAGAQKNIGPSGITLVIVRDDLIGKAAARTPAVFDYRLARQHDSMFNTPPTFAWYLSGLVFKWLRRQGGLAAIAQRNQQKATLLYQAIDQSDFYHNDVLPANRSLMNVTFRLADESLNERFLQRAAEAGLNGLKGHRIVGGMRASIYNAMPPEGVRALIAFMQDFERHYT